MTLYPPKFLSLTALSLGPSCSCVRSLRTHDSSGQNSTAKAAILLAMPSQLPVASTSFVAPRASTSSPALAALASAFRAAAAQGRNVLFLLSHRGWQAGRS